MEKLWKDNGIDARLGEALVSLLRNHTIEEISVKMICSEAGVNRSTFYNYFDDKYELCNAVMNASIEVFISLIEKRFYEIESQQKDFGPEQYLVSPELLEGYLELVKEYREIFLLFAMSHGQFQSQNYYDELVTKIVLPVLKQHQIDDIRVADYMSVFYLGAVHNVVLSWIRNDCEESVSYIARIILQCVHIPH